MSQIPMSICLIHGLPSNCICQPKTKEMGTCLRRISKNLSQRPDGLSRALNTKLRKIRKPTQYDPITSLDKFQACAHVPTKSDVIGSYCVGFRIFLSFVLRARESPSGLCDKFLEIRRKHVPISLVFG